MTSVNTYGATKTVRLLMLRLRRHADRLAGGKATLRSKLPRSSHLRIGQNLDIDRFKTLSAFSL
jgi:hypothetical protein